MGPIAKRLMEFVVDHRGGFQTGEQVRVIGGRHLGKLAVVLCETHRRSGMWVIRFFNGNETVIEENLMERTGE
jgi:hypothetical protein